MTRVLIVGGGTGGTLLANLLDPRRFDVTLLSASSEHLFQPALLYVALARASPAIARPERSLLASGVRLVQQRVKRIDLSERRVETFEGGAFGYDAVVLATGARTDPSQVPGLAETAERFGNFHAGVAAALKLRASLEAFRGGVIALGQASPICVCPPSPVEGILLVDRLLRRRGLRDKTKLVFFTPYPRAYPAEAVNAYVEPRLKAQGIELRTFFDLDKIDPASGTLTSIEGETIACDLPIVIPPFVGADITYAPDGVLTPDRFILTDKNSLRVKGAEAAFAIGDAANLPTSKAGVGAHLQAKAVAKTLEGGRASFDGRTNCPMDLADGTGLFVISSYDAPAVRCPPTRLNRFLKMMMGTIYWLSLRGYFEPVFDLYFAWTAPKKTAPPVPPAPAAPVRPL